MSDFLFVIKSLIVAVMVVMVMQIKTGSGVEAVTLEEQAVMWMHESSAVDALRSVSAGAIKAVQEGSRYIGSFFDASKSKVLNRDRPGARLEGVSFRRSESFERSRERDLKNRSEQTEPVENVDES